MESQAEATYTDDYTREDHILFLSHELADEMERGARLVGHLARNTPEWSEHPSELYDYMDIVAQETRRAADRVTKLRDRFPSAYALDDVGARFLVELAHVDVVARAMGDPALVDDAENRLLADGWWTTVLIHAGHRLEEYATIGEEWDAANRRD